MATLTPPSFVTPVFESETALLELQARSFARFVRADAVARIVVVDNTARGIPGSRSRSLLAAYGDLRDRVDVVEAAQVCRLPRTTGWHRQQLLKLEVARLLPSPLYVTLDAKNHFVAPPGPWFFQSPDGKPCVNAYSYEHHPFRERLIRTLRYFEIDPAPYVGHFTASVTPFVLDVSQVSELLRDVAERSGREFADEFLRQDFTEYLLYSAAIVASGRTLDDAFHLHQVFSPNIWPSRATEEHVTSAVAQAVDRGSPLFSVHRRALAAMDQPSIDALVRFWASRGLFDDEKQARQYVAQFRRDFVAGERRRRLRELPVRSRMLISGRVPRRSE